MDMHKVCYAVLVRTDGIEVSERLQCTLDFILGSDPRIEIKPDAIELQSTQTCTLSCIIREAETNIDMVIFGPVNMTAMGETYVIRSPATTKTHYPQVEQLIAMGYRRTSHKHCMVSRVDRPDFVQVLARHLRRAPADFYVPGSEKVDGGWCSYYRRVLTKDTLTVSPADIKRFPSSDHDATGYMPKPGDLSGRASIDIAIAHSHLAVCFSRGCDAAMYGVKLDQNPAVDPISQQAWRDGHNAMAHFLESDIEIIVNDLTPPG